ncbi:hypothetical protein VCHA36O163_190064 [Vibrio chagasii]|nr:hypothetical protein VCHA31O71_190001 [Vibrio chagasii]CAH6829153.1 hypothetical protein VCHA36O163_190064 [Vibrio chagasii]
MEDKLRSEYGTAETKKANSMSRLFDFPIKENMVEGDGFEPSKAVPADLQSAPFGHSGTPPGCVLLFTK